MALPEVLVNSILHHLDAWVGRLPSALAAVVPTIELNDTHTERDVVKRLVLVLGLHRSRPFS